MKEYRPYVITVKIEGFTKNFTDDPNGIVTFKPRGNKRTTKISALNMVRKKCRLAGCVVTELISIEENLA